MKAIAVNGISKTGKTTVCEALISGLRKRGYSVGSVKEIHAESFAIDPDPNTNTRRHRTAGSQLVTARGMQETDVLYQSMLPIEKILQHYDHDFVILEGVSDCNVPRIITAHCPEEIDKLMDERVIAVSGVIANSMSGEYHGQPIYNVLEQPEALVDLVEQTACEPLPNFDPKCCTACDHTCRELTGLVVHGQAKRSDCKLTQQGVELLINGRPVVMVPFVQRLLKNAVVGVASELDGFSEHSEIEVRFKL